VLYQGIRQELGTVFRSLAEQWECKVEEGHLMPDHVHMLLSVPPKHSVSNVMGFIKGKSAIHIARVYAGRRRNFVGQHFWARGYWVSTIGKNEAAVRQYIQNQEKEDKRLEQLELVALWAPPVLNRFERFTLSQASGFAGGRWLLCGTRWTALWYPMDALDEKIPDGISASHNVKARSSPYVSVCPAVCHGMFARYHDGMMAGIGWK
jgi:putative transposase